jgi:hypothetical protein
MLFLVVYLSVLLAGQGAAQCARSMLQQDAEAYVAAVKAGNFAYDGSYTENFQPSKVKDGIHNKPIRVGLSRSLLDTTQCATYSEIIAHENQPPMVIGTQRRYTGGKLSKIETVWNTKENGWVADPAVTYKYAAKDKRDMIPEGQRDTRATLQGVVDAYFDRFSNGSVNIPHHNPCERIEGKMRFYPDCTTGIPTSPGMKMTNRRYVIDEPYGTTDVFLSFGGGMPDSHEFRIEGGKIRIIHAITVAKGGKRGG